MKIIYITILLALLFVSSTLNAATEKLPIGLKAWYPDNWQKAYDPDKFIVRSPDGSAIVMFHIQGAADIQAAENILAAELARVFANYKIITQPKDVRINGLDGILVDGVGLLGNTYVMWVARAIVYKNNALIVIGCAETSQFSVNKSNIGKIVESVKR